VGGTTKPAGFPIPRSVAWSPCSRSTGPYQPARQAQRVDRTIGESNLGGKGLIVAGAIGHEKSCPISRFPHSYRDRASFPKRALHGGIFSPVICGHTHPWEWEIVTG
jgi:hypothetical protein